MMYTLVLVLSTGLQSILGFNLTASDCRELRAALLADGALPATTLRCEVEA